MEVRNQGNKDEIISPKELREWLLAHRVDQKHLDEKTPVGLKQTVSDLLFCKQEVG